MRKTLRRRQVHALAIPVSIYVWSILVSVTLSIAMLAAAVYFR